jgi:DNA-binding LytR/AlgR family response regulator
MLKQRISVLIVDSELISLKHTISLLEKNASVSRIDSVEDTDLALPKILDSSPDLILLEYPPIGKTGKEFIKFIKTKQPEPTIVFVSKSKENAANAIRDGVFNYLLNPIVREELEEIIEKTLHIQTSNVRTRINQIIENAVEDTKLQLQTVRGYIFIDTDEILYCKADGVYTEIFLTKNRKEVCYLFLAKVETMLQPQNFLRISRSYLINMKYIRKIIRSNNTIILSSDGREYEIKGARQQIKLLTKFSTE